MSDDRQNPDLDVLLGSIDPPPASQSARAGAFRAAMAAYDAVQEAVGNTTQDTAAQDTAAQAETAEAQAEKGTKRRGLFRIITGGGEANDPAVGDPAAGNGPANDQTVERQRDIDRRDIDRRGIDRRGIDRTRPFYPWARGAAIAASLIAVAVIPYAISGQIIPGISNERIIGNTTGASMAQLSSAPNVRSIPGELGSPFYDTIL
ncbi:MAG: hypothetical protein AAF556_09380, partial [Pseudomonadota bacterium]